MIERQYGHVIIVCDDCGETFMGGKGEPFEVVWADAKDEGWTVTKDGDEWVHWCHQPCEPSPARRAA